MCLHGLLKTVLFRAKYQASALQYWIILLVLLYFALGCGGGSGGDSLPKERLQSIVNEAVTEGSVPGAILGVRSGNKIWVGVAGETDTASRTPMTPGMQVRLASVTKTFTAVLIMSLVEDGILSIEDTVETHLPGLVPQGNKMTLKMLLNHSAGVADHTANKEFWSTVYAQPTRQWNNQDILFMSMPLTPEFDPGTQFSYSNTGYYLLGVIMESATGEKVSSLLKERIAEPAGLELTTLNRQSAFEGLQENGYAWVFTTDTVEPTRNWNFSWDWTAGSGISTAEDMLRFTDHLFKGLIITPKSLDMMISPDSFGPGTPYGLGFTVTAGDDPINPFRETLIGHDGDNPGTATRWYYLPDHDVTIFAAINRNDIPEGPGHEPPVNGSAVTMDMLKKVINALIP